MIKNVLFVFLLTLSFAYVPSALAQQQKPTGQSSFAGPKKQAATIILAGLGGAVLGLSTLSFYGRPQDYLVNIAIGAAVGVIVGTVYVTYKAASQPEDFYGSRLESFSNSQRVSQKLDSQFENSTLMMNYKWSF